MTTLQQVTGRLLDDRKIAEKLNVADIYIQQYLKLGDHFILPREHAFLKPVIETYARDLPKFVDYVKALRDTVAPGGEEFNGLRELHRRLTVRATQRRMREITDAAVAMAVQKRMISDEYVEKQRYAKRCTQVWAQRRAALRNSLRSNTKSGRVSLEEQEVALAEFWATVRDEVDRGEVPKP